MTSRTYIYAVQGASFSVVGHIRGLCFESIAQGTRKIILWVKVPASKPDDLSSILKTHL